MALLGATFFGSGLLPKAPGTWGTLFALPLWWRISEFHQWTQAGVWLGLAAWGVWSSKVFDEMNETQDNQNIVMDEATGVGIAAATAAGDFAVLFAAFVLFRAFDILKPWPVKLVDQWSHSSGSRWHRAIGVMADDWIAGLQALALIVLAQHYGWLPST